MQTELTDLIVSRLAAVIVSGIDPLADQQCGNQYQ